MTGALNKLLMTRFSLSKGIVTLEPSVCFEAMINPQHFTHTTGISYDKTETMGQAAATPRFNAVDAETASFKLWLDGTGAVHTGNAKVVSVEERLAQLNKVVYSYVGNKHEPGYVRLLWGGLIFFCRMESMTTKYTLFKPSGAPLRAEVDLRFVGAMSKERERFVSNRSSPDMSHRVLVREGDTLPLLCERIYGDPGYYIDVARFNGLSDFRRLEPGRQLHFPPLE
ncbi:MAG: peptidoglycan-binding protein [Rubrivivax sp.]|nr:peptidoglycan-binding protein [Rubrivivax sp.]